MKFRAGNVIYSSWSAYDAATGTHGHDANSNFSDPQLENFSSHNYTPSNSNSPLVGAANTTYAPFYDQLHNVRDGSPDIGARELSSNSSGTMTGSGTLTASGLVVVTASASLTGTGAIDPDPVTEIVMASASISGTGSMGGRATVSGSLT